MRFWAAAALFSPLFILFTSTPISSDRAVDVTRIADDLYGRILPISPEQCILHHYLWSHPEFRPDTVAPKSDVPNYFSGPLQSVLTGDPPHLRPGHFLWLDRRTEMYAWHMRARREAGFQNEKTACVLGWIGYGARRDCVGKENPRATVKDAGPYVNMPVSLKSGEREIPIQMWRTDLWIQPAEADDLRPLTTLPLGHDGFFYLKEECIQNPTLGCERIRWIAAAYKPNVDYTVYGRMQGKRLVGPVPGTNPAVTDKCSIHLPLDSAPSAVKTIFESDSVREFSASFPVRIVVAEVGVRYEKHDGQWLFANADVRSLRGRSRADRAPAASLKGLDADLFHAVKEGDVREVRKALAGGANPRAQDGFSSALCIAAEHGRTEIVRILIGAGAHPDDPLPNGGNFPIEKAAEHGHADVIAVLLEKGGSLRSPRNRVTPLMFAARERRSAVIQLLLSSGAKVNDVVVIGNERRTALDFAEATEDWEITELLRSKGGVRGADARPHP